MSLSIELLVFMTRVLVNGTAAKEGGALTILNSYIESKSADSQDFFYIFSPICPDVMPVNSKWIRFRTGGFFTLFFSLFLSGLFAVFLRCDKVVSFSNINTMLTFFYVKRVTYFHNMLILESNSIKYRFLRFCLRFFFQYNSKFIFQSYYVKDKFSTVLGLPRFSSVCWPGIKSYKNVRQDTYEIRGGDFYSLVLPITDTSNDNKNFDYALQLLSLDSDSKLRFSVTSSPESGALSSCDCLSFVGSVPHDAFLDSLKRYDGVLILSKTESLCLPIFEALNQQVPVFVLEQDYIKGLYQLFGDIKGLYVFSDFRSLIESLEQAALDTDDYYDSRYVTSDWDF
ncbi:hypothetical protein DN730_10450 [Marinomonas piezotolerans]|uniref:Glycosyl transferase family 1 domain-containing protein n=1 Tax=Marinomonas piezotolerans TaxID=2213058 RepID=A0A370U8J1_9GAMM|nr:hypothetical protein [Marinomonas piezotolerans]RDL44048.1 hypothetical protein DN730_10450 [Marinomonas piezotolerans]